jgi:hypothetical protein
MVINKLSGNQGRSIDIILSPKEGAVQLKVTAVDNLSVFTEACSEQFVLKSLRPSL